MNTNYRKMILELSEHDALRLLALTKKEIGQAYNPWRPYWEHLAQNIQQTIERADSNSFQAGQDTGSLSNYKSDWGGGLAVLLPDAWVISPYRKLYRASGKVDSGNKKRPAFKPAGFFILWSGCQRGDRGELNRSQNENSSFCQTRSKKTVVFK